MDSMTNSNVAFLDEVREALTPGKASPKGQPTPKNPKPKAAPAPAEPKAKPAKKAPAKAPKKPAKAAPAPKAPKAKAAPVEATPAPEIKAKRTRAPKLGSNGKPVAPNFSADSYKRWRPKLAEMVAAAQAGDTAAMLAIDLPAYSTACKALGKYRDAVIAQLTPAEAL